MNTEASSRCARVTPPPTAERLAPHDRTSSTEHLWDRPTPSPTASRSAGGGGATSHRVGSLVRARRSDGPLLSPGCVLRLCSGSIDRRVPRLRRRYGADRRG